jgi:hypothetical protein
MTSLYSREHYDLLLVSQAETAILTDDFYVNALAKSLYYYTFLWSSARSLFMRFSYRNFILRKACYISSEYPPQPTARI